MRLLFALLATAAVLGVGSPSYAQQAQEAIVEAGKGCPAVNAGDSITFKIPYTYKKGDLGRFDAVFKPPTGPELITNPGRSAPSTGTFEFKWIVPTDAPHGKWRGKGIVVSGPGMSDPAPMPTDPPKQVRRLCFIVK